MEVCGFLAVTVFLYLKAVCRMEREHSPANQRTGS